MQITNRSPQHGRAWVAAMLFRFAWRMTPPSMRGNTVMSYGLDAGVPSQMVLCLRRKRYNATP